MGVCRRRHNCACDRQLDRVANRQRNETADIGTGFFRISAWYVGDVHRRAFVQMEMIFAIIPYNQ